MTVRSPSSACVRWLGTGLFLGLFLSPGTLQGQIGGDCDVPSHNGFVTLSLSNGSRITYFSFPTIVCSGDTRISADSAVVYEATNYTQLFNHVVFRDANSRLTADQAHYFDQEKRLRAWGQVVLTDLEEGSIIRGDTMVLLRAGPGRPEDQLTVLGMRPHATLYPTRQPLAPEPVAAGEATPADEIRPEPTEDPSEARRSRPERVAPDSAAAYLQDTARTVPPDSAALALGDTAAAPPPDSAALALGDTAAAPPPDSAALALGDTAAAPPPDSAALALGDTAAAVPPDSAAQIPPDTAMAVIRDPAAAVRPDTGLTILPDSATVVPVDTATVPQPVLPRTDPPPTLEERTPYEIRAKRMFLEGQRYFRATGSVTIERDSVNAVADSVEYDEGEGALFLSEEARMTTGGFDLSAATIRLDIPQDEIRSVLAREDALLEGEDLWLLAPTISLVLTDGKVERLIAVQEPPGDSLLQEDSLPGPEGGARRRRVPEEVRGMGLDRFPPRPHALAQDFLLWADSIEVLAPGEVLEEVWAMGTAHGESLARDSLNTADTDPLFRRDWLEGDTIVAIFVPDADSTAVGEGERPEADPTLPPSAGARPPEEAPADSARFRLDRLVARVGARSLYRISPTDSTLVQEDDRRLAIHYVIGDEITIVMRGGEVDRMEVAGNTRGIHLEPVALGRKTTPPDTTGIPPGGNPGGRR